MELTYKVITNGYQIYLNGNLWIEQGEKSNGFFPNRVNNADGSVNLEESCKAHIQEILDAQAQAQEAQSQLDRIENNTASLKADIEQSAIDNYTLELIENGVL